MRRGGGGAGGHSHLHLSRCRADLFPPEHRSERRTADRHFAIRWHIDEAMRVFVNSIHEVKCDEAMAGEDGWAIAAVPTRRCETTAGEGVGKITGGLYVDRCWWASCDDMWPHTRPWYPVGAIAFTSDWIADTGIQVYESDLPAGVAFLLGFAV